jgi:copper chaperone CopZ
MKEHTLSVSFDTDQVSLESIIDALNGAGYHVPEYRQIN